MTRALPELQDGQMLLPQGGRIVPSMINPWRGSRHPDQRYTRPQLRVMGSYGLNPETCEDVVVRSSVSASEYYWNSFEAPPIYICPCPIIERRGDGSQCLVIAPAGMKKWVYSNGSITKGPQIGFNKRRRR